VLRDRGVEVALTLVDLRLSARVLVNISRVLDDNRLFAYDEADKVYSLFMSRGFIEVKPQIVKEDKIVLDIFAGRDSRSGSVKHLYVNILTGKRVEVDLYYWDIASSAAFTWIFFEDVDYLPTTSQYSGVIIARKPRRVLNLKDFIFKTPTMLRSESAESTSSV
jgi:hypothetical protein